MYRRQVNCCWQCTSTTPSAANCWHVTLCSEHIILVASLWESSVRDLSSFWVQKEVLTVLPGELQTGGVYHKDGGLQYRKFFKLSPRTELRSDTQLTTRLKEKFENFFNLFTALHKRTIISSRMEQQIWDSGTGSVNSGLLLAHFFLP